MEFYDYFPIWNKLSPDEQKKLISSVYVKKIPAGTIIHAGGTDCTGLMLVRSGQLRAFIFSEAGKEITIYRLFEYDMCLLSASCLLNSIQFDLNISAEKDTEVWIIPLEVYKALMEQSAPVANYTNEIMASRFTDVMWLIEQILWKSFDKRLAAFLLAESNIESTHILKITHEQIACHLGTAREVVTRMLKYFQMEGMVRLTRGTIEIINDNRLALLAN